MIERRGIEECGVGDGGLELEVTGGDGDDGSGGAILRFVACLHHALHLSLSLSLSLSQSLGLLVNGEGQRALAVYTWRVFLGSLVGFHYQLSRMRFRTHGSDKAVIRVIGFGKRILSCC